MDIDESWRAKPRFQDDPKCPSWLRAGDALDLRQVFLRCRGFVTWGSPLETFAHLWPAVVQIGHRADENMQDNFEWINLYDPTDIIASDLTSYGISKKGECGSLKPKNFWCKSSILVFKSHSYYFNVKSRDKKNVSITVLKWMLSPSKSFENVASESGIEELTKKEVALRWCASVVQWVLILVIGLIIWPYAAFAFMRAIDVFISFIMVMSGFDENAYNLLWNGAFFWLQRHRMNLDLFNDLHIGVRVLVSVGIVLCALGILHFLWDLWVDRQVKKPMPAGSKDIIILGKDDQ